MLNKQKRVVGIEYSALFDATRAYRYSLSRTWYTDHRRIVFVMLNPSTADEQKNDPTIQRCMGFARSWQFGSLEVVNLFAYRATDSRELLKVADPIGAENDYFLMRAIERCSHIVLAWGTKGQWLGRDRQVMKLLGQISEIHCLGTTKQGHPRHPLYVRSNTQMVPFLKPQYCANETAW